MGQYTTKGLYNTYDKNNKERDKTDYYATPPEEVTNILNALNIDFTNLTILEPCAGGGHMVKGIEDYLKANNQSCKYLFGTELHKHNANNPRIYVGEDYDFLADNYGGEIIDKLDDIDWIIMNPPYATIEPFTIRALEIANKGVIMLARLQFLEGEKRYSKILSINPPTDVYVYVDRVQCWKGGDKPEGSSAQAYAWFIWDKESKSKDTKVHWLRRVGK